MTKGIGTVKLQLTAKSCLQKEKPSKLTVSVILELL